jgi:NhaA family Na+:H+ antiporter
MVSANKLGVRHPLPYALLGIALWMAVLPSGVHATIAGVVGSRDNHSGPHVLDAPQFLRRSRQIIEYFERCATRDLDVMKDAEQQIAIGALEDTCEKAQQPLHVLESSLHPWVTEVIMPVFALANAGVTFGGGTRQCRTEVPEVPRDAVGTDRCFGMPG